MIICCGESLIDFVPQSKGTGPLYKPCTGGSPYNTAIASSRLGASAAFLGSISTDFFGDLLVEKLEENGVCCSFISRKNDASTLGFVQLSDDNQARYAFYAEKSADRNLLPDDIQVLPDEASVIHIGSISLLVEPVSGTVRELIHREKSSRLISYDPNIRPGLIRDRNLFLEQFSEWVSSSDLVKISDEDIAWLFPDTPPAEAACGLLDSGPTLVVLTCGSEGVTAFSGSGTVSVGAVKTKVKDTIGAGDTFQGGMLSYLQSKKLDSKADLKNMGNKDIEEMLRFSSAAASVTCSREGADPPRLDELPVY